MKRSFLIAVAAVGLVLPVAPAALAGDDYRGGGGRRDRDERRHDHYDDHRHDRHREARYVVHYHLDGRGHELRAKSSDRAHRMVGFLRSVGARAHVDGRRIVHYRMRGDREIVRYSREDAHRLAQKLEGYGFHAHVDRE